jgi:predicted metal-binding protein
MQTADLEKYCERAIKAGVNHAKIIHPSTVVTAPWVRMKCLFGCPYRINHCCPPTTPTPEETRRVLDSYSRAILFHIEAPKTPERGKRNLALFDMLVTLEGEIFKNGYYKAFVYLAGPCPLCKECAIVKNEPCVLPGKARPSMESCGIDVYQTARNNGFFIRTLRDKAETQNLYCLMLVD